MKYTAGVDIGGTKIGIAIISENGEIAAKSRLPTNSKEGFPSAISRLASALKALQEENKVRIIGIGIGCAGPVDPFHGTIHNPYTLPGWDGCNIVEPLTREFRVPVYLENDADAAAMGECFFGAGRGNDPVLMLTFGTGVGGALIAQGRIYRGVLGEHPEMGHVPVREDGPECYCGISGCLESLASGTAINSAARAAGFADGEAVFEAAAAGDATAERIVDQAIQSVRTSIWSFVHTFLPQRIILGGGLMEEHYDLFAPAIEKHLKKITMLPPGSGISLAPAQLGNNAGMIGGGAIAFARR